MMTMFHFPSGLSEGIKNMMELKESPFEIGVIIDVHQLSCNGEYECNCSVQDECDDQILADSDSIDCLLPFYYTNTSTKPLCSTFDEGRNAIEALFSLKKICQKSCTKLSIEYKDITWNYLLSFSTILST